ncbi:hypothetical protein IKP85_00020 [bacterium]|nr:hypothetical protein [bacterium]
MGNSVKKLGVMSSGNSDRFGAVIEHFKNRNDIKIVCISDNLKSDIFNLSKPDYVETKYLSPEGAQNYFMGTNFDLIVVNDYKSKLDRKVYEFGKFINIHQSLLPAFQGDNALYRAFESGVKVSGITIHTLSNKPENDKIITQYPVLITNLMHFDEFEQAIINLENALIPIVTEKLLDGKLFDFQDLYDAHSKSCSGGCGSCKSCH